MFKVTINNNDNSLLNEVIITNETLKLNCSIYPNLGASIQKLNSIGFYGLKNYFYKGIHIGGIFHFMNTLRRLYDDHRLDKVVVFWDGDSNSSIRK